MTPLPTLIASRGSSWDAPENTLTAFLLAWMEGAEGIVTQLQMTKDGKVVCFNDESLARTAGKEKLLCNTTFEELRGLDVGKWKRTEYKGQSIPTLSGVLSTVPQRGHLILEVKSGAAILPAMVAALDAAPDARERVTLASHNLEFLMAAGGALPGVKRLLLCKRTTSDGIWEPSMHILEAALRMVGADGLALDSTSVLEEPAIAKRLAAVGKELHVWTVNRAPAARQLNAIGVNALWTERPGWLRRRLLSRPTPDEDKDTDAEPTARGAKSKPRRRPALL